MFKLSNDRNERVPPQDGQYKLNIRCIAHSATPSELVKLKYMMNIGIASSAAMFTAANIIQRLRVFGVVMYSPRLKRS